MSVLRVSRRFTSCSQTFASPLMHRGFTTTPWKYGDGSSGSSGPMAPKYSSTSGHVSWDRFLPPEMHKDVAVMKAQLDRVRGEVHEVKSDLKDLEERIDTEFERMDMKFERSDNKIWALLFLSALVLVPMFDSYMTERAQRHRTTGENCTCVTKK